MRRRTVLDTSVLIADPACIGSFVDTDLVVPLTVIEELDGLKNRLDDVGRAARSALRAIEELRIRNGGTLADPIAIGSCTLQIEINGVQKHRLVEHGLDPASPDNRIIGAALGQAERGPTTMVSNDAALRIKAAHLGVMAVEHRRTARYARDMTIGWASFEVGSSTIDRLYHAGAVDAVDIDGVDALVENEFAVLRAGSQSALARRVGDDLTLLSHNAPEAWGLRARSKEQRFALELLLDPGIEVVALDGRAGTGKTVLAIAAGFEQVVEHSRYERLAVYRPLVPVGRADVGYLPGGLDEKLDPWMSAIHDAVVALTDHRSSSDARRMIDELTSRGQLSLESVTFLRGRSLATPDRRHRRSPEPRADDPQDDPHPGRREQQGHLHRRHEPDRRALPRRVEQRPRRADRGVPRPAVLRPHHPHRLRAQRCRQPRRRTAVSANWAADISVSDRRPPGPGFGPEAAQNETVTPSARFGGMAMAQGPEAEPVFAVVDVETSGLRPGRDHVLQIAVVTVDAAGTVLDQLVDARAAAPVVAPRRAAPHPRHHPALAPIGTTALDAATPSSPDASDQCVRRPQRQLRRRVHRACCEASRGSRS